MEQCPLMPAELDALKLIGEGHSTKEAARLLGKSPSTIKSQLSSAYGRLGVSDAAQAVIACFKAGWLDISAGGERPDQLFVLQQIAKELRALTRTVKAAGKLSAPQRTYLHAFEQLIYAREDEQRTSARASMDRALATVLADAGLPARRSARSRDLVDLLLAHMTGAG